MVALAASRLHDWRPVLLAVLVAVAGLLLASGLVGASTSLGVVDVPEEVTFDYDAASRGYDNAPNPAYATVASVGAADATGRRADASSGPSLASSPELVAPRPTPQTTILGENMVERVMPFADATGSRTLGFGATADEWASMTPRQRWRLNDGMLRARIGEGDAFRYIGQDPLRPPDVRARFDLTRSELLRLDERGIPYDVVSPLEVFKTIGRS